MLYMHQEKYNFFLAYTSELSLLTASFPGFAGFCIKLCGGLNEHGGSSAQGWCIF
jgi:hypothetical protein